MDFWKPKGWRKEPARHALAAKGIETKRELSGSQRALMPSQQALQTKARSSGTPVAGDDLKASAAEDLAGRALSEANGDEEGALDLIKDPKWLDENAKFVARDYADGAQAMSLQRELKSAFQNQNSSPVEKATVESKEK